MGKSLSKYAWFSVIATILIIAIKLVAYFITGSVGLFSEALESVINLIASTVALAVVKLSEKPPDVNHPYGHSKAEYFSSIFEGVLILVLAGSVILASVNRLAHPKPISQPTEGIVLSILATAINLVIILVLFRAAKKHNSITLEADAHYHLTDIWTSVGAVAGVSAAVITKLNFIDPVIGLVLAVHIGLTGLGLIKRSMLGFMDTSIAREEMGAVRKILDNHAAEGIRYHALASRQSGRRKFVFFHLLVPDDWTVKKAHDLSESIEKEIINAVQNVSVTTHIEPKSDPASEDDISIDRE